MLNLDTHVLIHALQGSITEKSVRASPLTSGVSRASSYGSFRSWFSSGASKWIWPIRK